MSRIRTITLGLAALLAALPAAAAEDHRQYADSKPEECSECHRGSGVMENHGAGFLKDHRALARKAPARCEQCHLQSWCSDCHHGGSVERRASDGQSRRGEQLPSTHAADFISTHAIKATDDPRACARCHETASFCSDCHLRQLAKSRASMAIRPHGPTFTGGLPDPSWVAFHRGEARRKLATCQGCHPSKADCSNVACHQNLGGR